MIRSLLRLSVLCLAPLLLLGAVMSDPPAVNRGQTNAESSDGDIARALLDVDSEPEYEQRKMDRAHYRIGRAHGTLPLLCILRARSFVPGRRAG